MKKLNNFIGGEWREPSTKKWLKNVEPGTGQAFSEVADSSAADVEGAVAAAKAAFPGWSKTKLQERVDVIEAVSKEVENRLEEFVAAESQDNGKPKDLARLLDIPRAVQNLRFYGREILQQRDEFYSLDGAYSYVQREPLGVVGLITPWNFPLHLLTWKLSPALLTGNTVIAKPSELTPYTATLLAEVFEKVKAPRGIFNLVHGQGSSAGQAVVEHPGVRAISFTGGTASGAKVAATAATKFKKVSLELGGKNPTVVFADCDFEATVKGVARSAFLNQGEICLCGSRILIEKSIYSKFRDALVEEVKTWKVGDPSERGTRIGAVVSEAHLEKIESYARLAKTEGGRFLIGGERARLSGRCAGGFFFSPTLIEGLASTCRTATEEIFGPIASLHTFESDDEAIEIANGVRYGLSASVWTKDIDRANRMAKSIQAGTVWINSWLIRDLRVPFGGVKDSGVGREGGRYSLEFFTDAKTVCVAARTGAIL